MIKNLSGSRSRRKMLKIGYYTYIFPLTHISLTLPLVPDNRRRRFQIKIEKKTKTKNNNNNQNAYLGNHTILLHLNLFQKYQKIHSLNKDVLSLWATRFYNIRYRLVVAHSHISCRPEFFTIRAFRTKHTDITFFFCGWCTLQR